MLAFVTLVAYPALLVFAAFSDLFTMTISNRISIALVVVYPALAVALGVPLAIIGLHFACAAAILIVTFAFFSFGWIGGGDAKLAAAISLWLGFEQIADYGLIAALLGGVLTIMVLQLRKWPWPAWVLSPPFMARLADKGNGVPYGIALAAAGLILYPDTTIWLSAAMR